MFRLEPALTSETSVILYQTLCLQVLEYSNIGGQRPKYLSAAKRDVILRGETSLNVSTCGITPCSCQQCTPTVRRPVGWPSC
jgi:hypothetical protein